MPVIIRRILVFLAAAGSLCTFTLLQISSPGSLSWSLFEANWHKTEIVIPQNSPPDPDFLKRLNRNYEAMKTQERRMKEGA